MDAIRKWCSRLRTHLTAGALRRRGLVMLLAALVVFGVVLLLTTGGDSLVAVGAEPLSAAELTAARRCLDDRGISYRIDAGRLLVSPADVRRVRALLADAEVLSAHPASAFDQIARENDLWQTQAQSAKRWQVAKMQELSRLIGEFPAVQRATVILEAGSARKLGSPAVRPTAAVHVAMKKDAAVTATLARAIADLVSGSVAGMDEKDVRIVDASGRSFRVAADGSVIGPPSDGSPPGKRLAGDDAGPPAQAVPRAAETSAGKAWPALAVALIVAGVVGGGAWAGVRRVRRRRAKSAAADQSRSEEDAHAAGAGDEVGGGDGAADAAAPGAFVFLRCLPAAELGALLEIEHPQTLAIVLRQLLPEQAAAVFDHLSEDKRCELTRRMADLGPVDAAVVREIEQAMRGRVRQGQPDQPAGESGTTTLADILEHAGEATERTVLETLEAQRPAAAEQLRRRLLAFEDLAKMPPESLRKALAEFEPAELAVALRAAGKPLKRRILSSLPGSAGRRVRRETDRMGPVRLSDVEVAQQRIVDAVRRVVEQAVGGEAPAEVDSFVA